VLLWGGWVLGFGFGFLGFGEMWVVGVDYIVFWGLVSWVMMVFGVWCGVGWLCFWIV